MATATYFDIIDAVKSYYGSGSDEWLEISKYGIREDTLPIIKQVPGVEVTTSKSGKILGYDYKNPFESKVNPVSEINSNVQTGMYGEESFTANVPSSTVTDPTTGTKTLESGAKVTNTGSKLASVADKVSLGVAGVSIGTLLGKEIDQALYDIDPEWWDEHFPSINPETWDDIATTEGGKDAIRAIFGLQDDSTTMYMNEDMVAYTYMMLLQNGAFSSQEVPVPYEGDVGDYITKNDLWLMRAEDFVNKFILPTARSDYSASQLAADFFNDTYQTEIQKDDIGFIYTSSRGTLSNALLRWYKLGNFEPNMQITSINNNIFTVNQTIHSTTRIECYYNNGSILSSLFTYGFSNAVITNLINTSLFPTLLSGNYFFIGSFKKVGIDGINDDSEATIQINPNDVINPSTGQPVTPSDNVDDVLSALKTQYPQLFQDSIYEDVPNDDGETTTRYTYIKVPYPNTDDESKPTTGNNHQNNPDVNPETNTSEELQKVAITITQNPTVPDTGKGNTPTVIIPSNTLGTGLWAVYRPTDAELSSFGGWLWSSDFVDQIKKLFNNPMDSIIGLHQVYSSVEVAGRISIKCGYIDSGISSYTVSKRYSTNDCGTIPLREYFGNVFDYDPYTQVSLYLPFIGIVPLKTADVMRASLTVIYHVDVLTGACLVEVQVKRDNAGGIIYTFTGSCAVSLPFTSGSYMNGVVDAAMVGINSIGAIASGFSGNLLAMSMFTGGAIANTFKEHTNVQKSGSFSGNSGAMGCKTPYLIITRPQSELADNYQHFVGIPSNENVVLGSVSGYARIKSTHVESIVNASEEEKREIESLLKSGVLIQ